ncbi:SMP-30/gluconolactonase/LRE family protein [Micromonospora peucetia]|uniref:Sugar lactone lactonase YvrE n=1 Tax=Micromonospora peucetia TaxID=47871 RepID=A0A1C6VZ61_9ACTN|nr:SMP-30/gluconolactonase/LRE family protein [Micromonospora peucetia]SCL71629.1 Sugar lactone lactonase YvrE [Micromonospora peucetia]
MVAPRPRAPRLIRPVREPATVPPPLDGPWAPADRRLDAVQLLPLPDGVSGPEDVVVDPSGRAISGTEDGRLWWWPVDAPPGTRPRPFADTGGRPLGVEIDPLDGSLVVCDAYRGLLRVTGDGAVRELGGLGARAHLADNATVAHDGTVYFTDSSDRFPLSHWKRDLLEHRPNGRVLAYDPRSGRTDVVCAGLYFPNGIALTPDESALMLAETATHRLVRVTLPDGAVTVLADLPAYPDNLTPVGDGTYWIAFPSPRVPVVERLLPHPRLRQLVAVLPAAVQPKPLRYGLVALVDGEGRVLRTLHGPRGGYNMITGVRQHGEHLWLGSLTGPGVARVPLG